MARPKKDLSFEDIEPPENGRFYTVNEVAELLHVNKHTVQARMRNGELKGKKWGGIWRISADQLTTKK